MAGDPAAVPPVRLWPEERALLSEARTAVLATHAPDGTARLVPICFAVEGMAPWPGAAAGSEDPPRPPVLWSPLDEKPKAGADPRRLARVRDLLADPRAELLVERWDEDWERLGWLRLFATAELVEPGAPGHDAAVVALRARYPQYAAHDLAGRPMLRFAIERVTAWVTRDG